MAGGAGSGRIRATSDEEKKRNGTFRKNTSEAASIAKAAAKIVVGPWLTEVEPPDVTLGAEGLKKYNRLATDLLRQNNLTTATREICQNYAIKFQDVCNRMAAGKSVPAGLMNKMDSDLQRLRIIENAPRIAPQGKKSRFDWAGFSNSRASSIRLRPHPERDPGEL